MLTIGSLRFRSLLNSDYKALSDELSAHPERINRYVNNLVSELGGEIDGQPSDPEHVYIVALAHHNNFSSDVLESVLTLLMVHAPPSVANLFAETAHRTVSKSISQRRSSQGQTNKTAPSAPDTRVLFQNVKQAIKRDSIERIRQRTTELLDASIPYVENTGDAKQHVLNCSRIALGLIRETKLHGHDGLKLAEDLLIAGLKWSPFDPYLWNHWAQCYIVGGDTEAAEFLQWESKRRIPYNVVGASIFAEFMAAICENAAVALEILDDALQYSPADPVLLTQKARFLYIADGDWSAAFSAAIQSAKIDPSRESAEILALLIAASKDEAQFRKAALQSIRTYHKDEQWLGHIGYMISARKDAVEKSIKFFELLDYRVRKSTLLANLYAKVIAAKGDEESLNRAIAISDDAIETIDDNIYSRMQKIEFILLIGRPNARDEALRLLDERDRIHGRDSHSVRLRAKLRDPSIDNKKLIRPAAPPTPSRSNPTFRYSGARELAKLVTVRKKLQQNGNSELELPREIRLGGELEKLEQLIKGNRSERDSAADRIREILKENPTFAYAELLAERHNLWRDDENSTPTFVVYFERALRVDDRALLRRLTLEYPRFEAMCIIARVALGDEDAFDELSNAISTVKINPSPDSLTLRHGLNAIGLLEIGEDVEAIVAAISEDRQRIKTLLRTANSVNAID